MALLCFPCIAPATVEQPSEWSICNSDEALLAQEEAVLEDKWKEIRESNQGFVIGKSTLDPEQEDYDQDGDDDEADNVEEESEGEEFEQETL